MFMSLNHNQTNGEKSNMLPLHLFNKDHGIINTMFQHSFNIDFPDLLFHVGNESDSLSCTGITLEDDTVDELLKYTDVNDPVSFIKGKLYLYTKKEIRTIDLAPLKTVDLRIPQIKLDLNFLKKIIEKFNIIDFQNDWGLSDAYSPNKVIKMLNESRDPEQIMETLKFLYGRGRGLTPSGDDIIVGFASILSAFGFKQLTLWNEQVKIILESRATTDVSESYIRAVLENYTSKKMVQFLKVIRDKDEEQLASSLLDIQNFGHTSGTDTLLGMYAAFILLESKFIH